MEVEVEVELGVGVGVGGGGVEVDLYSMFIVLYDIRREKIYKFIEILKTTDLSSWLKI